MNAINAASGHVAFVLALPTGANFASGAKEVVKVTLRASTAASGTYTVALGDEPVPCEVSDADANALASAYVNGSITINPAPSLRIALSGSNVMLAWPESAAGFNLQESADGLGGWNNVGINPKVSNGENVVTLPVSDGARFYRLNRP